MPVQKLQKSILRYCGIGLLICGILLSVVFGQIKEANQPRKMTYGYTIGDSFTQTGDGYIGGNVNNVQDASIMGSMGIFVAIAGGAMTAGSFFIQDEKTQSKESENQ